MLFRSRENSDPERVNLLKKQYKYLGEQTCAGDGLCSTSCPMKINVGDLTHVLREMNIPTNGFGYKIGDYVANHFAGIKSVLRPTLSVANAAHSVLGTSLMSSITRGMHKAFKVPQWTPAMPKPYYPNRAKVLTLKSPKKVVYFPSCINQTMGLEKKSPEELPRVFTHSLVKHHQKVE